MPQEVIQVGMEKAVYFFGSVITFLLTIITFFLGRWISSNDRAIRELKTVAQEHEVRISILEIDEIPQPHQKKQHQ